MNQNSPMSPNHNQNQNPDPFVAKFDYLVRCVTYPSGDPDNIQAANKELEQFRSLVNGSPNQSLSNILLVMKKTFQPESLFWVLNFLQRLIAVFYLPKPQFQQTTVTLKAGIDLLLSKNIDFSSNDWNSRLLKKYDQVLTELVKRYGPLHSEYGWNFYAVISSLMGTQNINHRINAFYLLQILSEETFIFGNSSLTAVQKALLQKTFNDHIKTFAPSALTFLIQYPPQSNDALKIQILSFLNVYLQWAPSDFVYQSNIIPCLCGSISNVTNLQISILSIKALTTIFSLPIDFRTVGFSVLKSIFIAVCVAIPAHDMDEFQNKRKSISYSGSNSLSIPSSAEERTNFLLAVSDMLTTFCTTHYELIEGHLCDPVPTSSSGSELLYSVPSLNQLLLPVTQPVDVSKMPVFHSLDTDMHPNHHLLLIIHDLLFGILQKYSNLPFTHPLMRIFLDYNETLVSRLAAENPIRVSLSSSNSPNQSSGPPFSHMTPPASPISKSGSIHSKSNKKIKEKKTTPKLSFQELVSKSSPTTLSPTNHQPLSTNNYSSIQLIHPRRRIYIDFLRKIRDFYVLKMARPPDSILYGGDSSESPISSLNISSVNESDVPLSDTSLSSAIFTQMRDTWRNLAMIDPIETVLTVENSIQNIFNYTANHDFPLSSFSSLVWAACSLSGGYLPQKSEKDLAISLIHCCIKKHTKAANVHIWLVVNAIYILGKFPPLLQDQTLYDTFIKIINDILAKSNDRGCRSIALRSLISVSKAPMIANKLLETMDDLSVLTNKLKTPTERRALYEAVGNIISSSTIYPSESSIAQTVKRFLYAPVKRWNNLFSSNNPVLFKLQDMAKNGTFGASADSQKYQNALQSINLNDLYTNKDMLTELQNLLITFKGAAKGLKSSFSVVFQNLFPTVFALLSCSVNELLVKARMSQTDLSSIQKQHGPHIHLINIRIHLTENLIDFLTIYFDHCSGFTDVEWQSCGRFVLTWLYSLISPTTNSQNSPVGSTPNQPVPFSGLWLPSNALLCVGSILTRFTTSFMRENRMEAIIEMLRFTFTFLSRPEPPSTIQLSSFFSLLEVVSIQYFSFFTTQQSMNSNMNDLKSIINFISYGIRSNDISTSIHASKIASLFAQKMVELSEELSSNPKSYQVHILQFWFRQCLPIILERLLASLTDRLHKSQFSQTCSTFYIHVVAISGGFFQYRLISEKPQKNPDTPDPSLSAMLSKSQASIANSRTLKLRLFQVLVTHLPHVKTSESLVKKCFDDLFSPDRASDYSAFTQSIRDLLILCQQRSAPS